MTERLVESRQVGDVLRETYVDHDGLIIFKQKQDVTPIVDQNKALMSENGKSSFGRDLVEVADIPLTVWHQWEQKYGSKVLNSHEGRAIVRRLLNDPEWAWLRTGGGRL